MRLLKIGALSLLAVLAPLTFDAETPGVIRLSEACGSLRGCAQADGYICAMWEEDLVDYRCAIGCGPTQE